eukprot:CAMPEP_0185032518 /NCGR_PEP_ID=MMETSP1103-20130426/20669_1 /TAXON_ID=36769 /ORGANISM="Paraphysomonas bandaiensis, Strain Caron Lab Isolate" /LENGTH=964 /DNA_ID=CAMNT_0027568451 /DNA_START=200 /DNA_END=3094 /DNA_ORIENTATION=+
MEYKEVLAIAGNFSINGELTNLAQYDISTGEWSNSYEAELYVYGESYGVIWDTSVNYSTPSDQLIVVGAFDTVSKTSQVQYCSVGVWTGISFNKVGEGLCPRGGGSSAAMMIQSSVLGDNGDLFVGGNFESRVWNGKEFVDVYDVAYFRGKYASWLPLEGGPLLCDESVSADCDPRVSTLEWDSEHKTLFIGGRFDMLKKKSIPGGLCMWTEDKGLMPFPGSSTGLSLSAGLPNGEATRLAYEPTSQSLFVAGSFSFIDDTECVNIAVWHRPTETWTCLYDSDRAISTVTTMTLDVNGGKLYLAGWASFQAEWKGRDWGSPYAVAWTDVNAYIASHTPRSESPTPAPSSDRHKPRRKPVLSSRTQSSGYRILHEGRMRSAYLRRRQSESPHIRARSPHNISGNFDGIERSTTFVYPPSVKGAIYSAWQKRGLDSFLHGNRSIHGTRKLKSSRYIRWDWLPGFSGGNGPIFGLAVGHHNFKDCLFIAGAFNNGPPIVLWIPAASDLGKRQSKTNGGDSSSATVIHVGALDDNIHGLVTSVSQLIVEVPHYSPPDPQPVAYSQMMSLTSWILLGSAILIGIFLGIVFTIRCSKHPYFRIPIHDVGGDDVLLADDNAEVSLEVLGGSSTDIDLRQCFAKATQARHLTTNETLVMIDPKEIILSKIIGEGSFGRVWSGVWRNNNVAVKDFVFAQAALTGGSQHVNSIVEEIIGEAIVMTCLNHPKILQLYGCSLTMQAVWIVSELCPRGSLRMLLNDTNTELSLATKASLCLDIADGMMYLHRRKPPIIHRDLKTHNVFITEPSPGKYKAKIGDWGSARAIALTKEKTLTQGVGTACWLAPEVIVNAHYSKESDVYAFAIVLWEVFTRQEVYPRLNAAQIIAKVANDGLRPAMPFDCPWESLMRKCWSHAPGDRPSFAHIMSELSTIYSQVKGLKSHEEMESTKNSSSWDKSETDRLIAPTPVVRNYT